METITFSPVIYQNMEVTVMKTFCSNTSCHHVIMSIEAIYNITLIYFFCNLEHCMHFIVIVFK